MKFFCLLSGLTEFWFKLLPSEYSFGYWTKIYLTKKTNMKVYLLLIEKSLKNFFYGRNTLIIQNRGLVANIAIYVLIIYICFLIIEILYIDVCKTLKTKIMVTIKWDILIWNCITITAICYKLNKFLTSLLS